MSHTPNQRNDFARDYIDVATRIAEFRAKHPDGALRPVNPNEPIQIISIGDKVFLQYIAAAYRSPEDPCPGIGIAWEPFPGRTPFTRDSEAANAETSAWGRAIVAALAADTKHGVASKDEVNAAKARQQAPQRPQKDPTRTTPRAMDGVDLSDGEAPRGPTGPTATDAQVKKIAILKKELGIADADYRNRLIELYNVISSKQLTIEQASDLIEKLTAAAAKKGDAQ